MVRVGVAPCLLQGVEAEEHILGVEVRAYLKGVEEVRWLHQWEQR